MTNVLLDLIFNKNQRHTNIIPNYISDIIINISDVFINIYSDLCNSEYDKIQTIKNNYLRQFGNVAGDEENLKKYRNDMDNATKLFNTNVEKNITDYIDRLQLYGTRSKNQAHSSDEEITFANIYLKGNLNPSKIVQYNHMQKLYNEYTKASLKTNIKEKFLLSLYYEANIFGNLHNKIIRKYDTIERDFLQKIRRFITTNPNKKILIIDDSDLTLLQCIYLYLQGFENIYFGTSTKSYSITKIDIIVSIIKDYVEIYDDISFKNFLFISPTVIQMGMPTLMFCQCDVDQNNIIEIYKLCEKVKHPIISIGKIKPQDKSKQNQIKYIEMINNKHLAKLFKAMLESEDVLMSKISEKITILKGDQNIFNPMGLTDKAYKNTFLYDDVDNIEEYSKRYILELIEHYTLLNNSYVDRMEKQNNDDDYLDVNNVVSIESILSVASKLPEYASLDRNNFDGLFKKLRFIETGQKAKKTNRLYQLL